jgi:hypothetical protein
MIACKRRLQPTDATLRTFQAEHAKERNRIWSVDRKPIVDLKVEEEQKEGHGTSEGRSKGKGPVVIGKRSKDGKRWMTLKVKGFEQSELAGRRRRARTRKSRFNWK